MIARILAIALALLAIAPQASALDPSARLRWQRHAHQPLKLHRLIEVSDDTTKKSPYVPMLIQVADEPTVDTLLSLGTIIYNRRDDILLTSVVRDSMQRAIKLHGVNNVSSSGDIDCNMDIARPYCHVDVAQSGGDGLPQAYDGQGVVAGFCDIGFDPHHIAFEGRVKALYTYNTPYGMRKAAVNPSEINEWVTDSADQFHATHVANILAGGYKGNGYYGVAPAADIVGTTSALYDSGILAGVEDVIAYAKEQGKPAVVNISLSSNLGPHDGSDLVCRYLSACSKDAIICLSAGNKGKYNCYAAYSLSSDNSEGRVTVNSLKTWDGFDVLGYAEFWSPDDTPFEFRFEVYDSDTGAIMGYSPWIGGTCEDDSLKVDLTSDPELSPYLTGKWEAESGVSTLNNRYCTAVSYDTHTIEVSSRGKWSRYYTCLVARTVDGKNIRLDGFSDATLSYFGKVMNSRNVYVGPDGSVNDMATAHGVVCIGNCVTRNTAPYIHTPGSDLPENPFKWNETPGSVTVYSSYSNVPTIERLPHFCAPGTYVVSALSNPYYAVYPDIPVSAVSQVDGKDYYWFPECGTSMSSPYTAGTFALWLQAYPQLSAEEAIAIAQSTACTDVIDFSDYRWGAGRLDALAGLKKVIEASGIIECEADPLVVVTADRRIEITDPRGSVPHLYTLSGQELNHRSTLAPGIYVLTLGAYSQKVIIR